MSAYTMWYREGTVSVAKNSYQVAGVSTYWLSAGINPGDMFTTDGSNFYEVSEITDSAHIVLKTPYLGDTVSEGKYAVVRNFNSGMNARIASLTAQLLSYFDRYIDTDMQSIHGKSAYEVAVQNGFTGTVTEWLESLKAAGEWEQAQRDLTALDGAVGSLAGNVGDISAEMNTLKTNTDALRYHNSASHNGIFRGKNLGTTITDEQWAAVKNGTYKDLYIGDYWMLNNRKYVIVHFDLCYRYNTEPYNMILWSYQPGTFKKWSYGDDAPTSVAGGFISSSIYINDWPGKCEQVVNDIGESHIQKGTDWKTKLFDLSSAVNTSTGQITATVPVTGLQIGMPCAYNVSGNIYPCDYLPRMSTTPNMQTRFTHLAFFRFRGTKKILPLPFDNCWLDSFRSSTAAMSMRGGIPGSESITAYEMEVKPLIAVVG